MKTLLTLSLITSEIDELERWVTGHTWDDPATPPTVRELSSATRDRPARAELLHAANRGSTR